MQVSLKSLDSIRISYLLPALYTASSARAHPLDRQLRNPYHLSNPVTGQVGF